MTHIHPSSLILEDRGLISARGDDSRSFLQGLISNDTGKITEQTAIYAAFLTPQGKYLHDFLIIEYEGALLIDCEEARLADLFKRLKMYKLRADVELEDVSEQFSVAALFGKSLSDSAIQGCQYEDPRHPEMGLRAIVSKAEAAQVLAEAGYAPMTREDYDQQRLKLTVPDGSRDLMIDKSTLMESGFDDLSGIDWNKGCYIGQELTARTKHRGLVKKRMTTVTFDGRPPPAGSIIKAGERDAGEMRSSIGGIGLALLRVEFLEQGTAELSVEGTPLTPVLPYKA